MNYKEPLKSFIIHAIIYKCLVDKATETRRFRVESLVFREK